MPVLSECDLTQRLDRLEGLSQDILVAMTSLQNDMQAMLGLYEALGSIQAGVPANLVAVLHSMTPKQHVAMQMVLGGRSNREIAECLGVTENTAKVHVRTIAAKLDVNTRAQIVATLLPVMQAMSTSDYEQASGGLPRDWDDKYGVGGIPDPYRGIYCPG